MVFLLTLVTLGVYSIVWYVKTKDEINANGGSVPTAWLMLVPVVNLWWLWRYCEGVEAATDGRTSAVLALVIVLLLGGTGLGIAILQAGYNRSALSAAPVPA